MERENQREQQEENVQQTWLGKEQLQPSHSPGGGHTSTLGRPPKPQNVFLNPCLCKGSLGSRTGACVGWRQPRYFVSVLSFSMGPSLSVTS